MEAFIGGGLDRCDQIGKWGLYLCWSDETRPRERCIQASQMAGGALT